MGCFAPKATPSPPSLMVFESEDDDDDDDGKDHCVRRSVISF